MVAERFHPTVPLSLQKPFNFLDEKLGLDGLLYVSVNPVTCFLMLECFMDSQLRLVPLSGRYHCVQECAEGGNMEKESRGDNSNP